jgi:hypothetical protein
MTKIVLATLINDDFCRLKKLAQNTVSCGLLTILGNMNRYNAGRDFEVILVVNKRAEDAQDQQIQNKISVCNSLPQEYGFVKQVLYHDNSGTDVGAYNLGYQYLKEITYAGDVLFMNTSLSGPSEDYWLLKYYVAFHKYPDVGLCGISMNSHDTNMSGNPPFKPHVQSFFLYTSMSVLTDVFPENLSGFRSQEKLDVIENGEIGISAKVLEKAYSIVCYNFPFFYFKTGTEWIIPFGELRGLRQYHELANKI